MQNQKLVLSFFFAFLLLGMVLHSPILIAEENDSGNASDAAETNADSADVVTDDATETDGNSDEVLEVGAETDETEEVDDETQEEVEEMDISAGAELRILQLQRQLLIHILRANLVIDSLKELGKDTTELEGIVAELGVLKEESAIIPDNKEEAVQKFVDIKKEARDLIKQFRELVREMSTESERANLRTKFSEIRENAELTALNERIKEARKELHKNKVKNALDFMGVTDEELLAQIESGEIAVNELREKLKGHYASLSEDVKIKTKDKLRKARIEMKKDRLRVIVKTTDGRKERLELRLEERADKLEARGNVKASERLRKVTELRKVAEKIDKRGSNSGDSE